MAQYKILAEEFMRQYNSSDSEITPGLTTQVLEIGWKCTDFTRWDIPTLDASKEEKSQWLSNLKWGSEWVKTTLAKFVLLNPLPHCDLLKERGVHDNYIALIYTRAAILACENILEYVAEKDKMVAQQPLVPHLSNTSATKQLPPSAVAASSDIDIIPNRTGHSPVSSGTSTCAFIDDRHQRLLLDEAKTKEDFNFSLAEAQQRANLQAQQSNSNTKSQQARAGFGLEDLMAQFSALQCSNVQALATLDHKISQNHEALRGELRSELENVKSVLISETSRPSSSTGDSVVRHKMAQPSLYRDRVVSPVGKFFRSLFGEAGIKTPEEGGISTTHYHTGSAAAQPNLGPQPVQYTSTAVSNYVPPLVTQASQYIAPHNTMARGDSGVTFADHVMQSANARTSTMYSDTPPTQTMPNRTVPAHVLTESHDPTVLSRTNHREPSIYLNTSSRGQPELDHYLPDEETGRYKKFVRQEQDYEKSFISFEKLKVHKQYTGVYRDYQSHGQWSKWFDKFCRLENPYGSSSQERRCLDMMAMLLEGQARETFLNIHESERTLAAVIERFQTDFDRDRKKSVYDLMNTIVHKPGEDVAALATKIRSGVREADISVFSESDSIGDNFLCQVFDRVLRAELVTEGVVLAETFMGKVEAAMKQEKILEFKNSGLRASKKPGEFEPARKPAGPVATTPVFRTTNGNRQSFGNGGRVSAIGGRGSASVPKVLTVPQLVSEQHMRMSAFGGVLNRGGGHCGGAGIPREGSTGRVYTSTTGGMNSFFRGGGTGLGLSRGPYSDGVFRGPGSECRDGYPDNWFVRPRWEMGVAGVQVPESTDQALLECYQLAERLYNEHGWEFGNCGFVHLPTSAIKNAPPIPGGRCCFRCGKNNHIRPFCDAVGIDLSSGRAIPQDRQWSVNVNRDISRDRVMPAGTYKQNRMSGMSGTGRGGTHVDLVHVHKPPVTSGTWHNRTGATLGTGETGVMRVDDGNVDRGGSGKAPSAPGKSGYMDFRLRGHSVVPRQNKNNTPAEATGGCQWGRQGGKTPVATTGYAKLQRCFDTGESVMSDNSDFDIPPRSARKTSSVSGDSSTGMTPPPLVGKNFSYRAGVSSVANVPQTPCTLKEGDHLSDTRKRAKKKYFCNHTRNQSDMFADSVLDLDVLLAGQVNSPCVAQLANSRYRIETRASHCTYDTNVRAVSERPLKLTQDNSGVWQCGNFQLVRRGIPTHTGARVYIDLDMAVQSQTGAQQPPRRSAVVKSLIDTGAGPSCISSTLVEKLGWTGLVDNKRYDNVKNANGGLMNVPGCIHLDVTLGGQSAQTCFMVVSNLAEPILIGQNLIEELDMWYYSRNKSVYIGEIGSPGEHLNQVPTFVQNYGVVSVVDSFDDRIFPVREGTMKPNHVHLVEVDISNLPIGGTYVLRPSERMRANPHVAIPNIVINRHSRKHQTHKVPMINVSKYNVNFAPERDWLCAEVVCGRPAESKHVFSPHVRKQECLETLFHQLGDDNKVAGVSLGALVGPGFDQKKHESLLASVLDSILEAEASPVPGVATRSSTSCKGDNGVGLLGPNSSCGYNGAGSSAGLGGLTSLSTAGNGYIEAVLTDQVNSPCVAQSVDTCFDVTGGSASGVGAPDNKMDGSFSGWGGSKKEGGGTCIEEEEWYGDTRGWAEQESVSDWAKEGSSTMLDGRVGIDLPSLDSPLADVPGLTLLGSEASDDQKRQLWLVLEVVHEVFARHSMDVGKPPPEFYHSIDTGDAAPVSQKLRRLAHAQREELRKIVKEMLENGIIEPSNSPWSSPAVLVAKKDGTWRFCVDYRQLNKVTVDDSYPMPRVDDTLAQLKGNSWFSCIDCQLGYWALPVLEADRPKTSFLVEEGQFSYTRMPFGLKTAPSSWMRMINALLAQHLGTICSCFFDDIIIFGRTFEEHLVNVATVLGTVRDSGLLIKGKKCHFARKRVEFLGHVVSEKGIEPQESKIKKITDCPAPNTVKKMRSFIGLLSYYRKFIPEFSTIAAPLYELCTGKGAIDLTPECHVAIAKLKTAVTTAPILGYPVIGKPFRIYTDASGVGMGAVLCQVNEEGNEYVIEWASKKFSAAERNYCTSERECYAVVWALRHFKAYILYDHVTLYTDHSALTFILNASDPRYQANYIGKYGRWALEIQSFKLKVEYRKGEEMGHADGLSRPPFIHAIVREGVTAVCMDQPYSLVHAVDFADSSQQLVPKLCEPNMCPLDDKSFVDSVVTGETVVSPLSIVDVVEAQASDKLCRLLKAKLLGAVCDIEPDKSQQTWLTQRFSEFQLCPRSGAVMHFHTAKDGFHSSRTHQLVVPANLRPRLLDQLHCSQFGGHLGYEKIFSVADQRYWWVGMRRDIQQYCQGCPKCEVMKYSNKTIRLEMVPIKVRYPFYRVGLDVLGPLPVTALGRRYVIILVDYFTKWVEAYMTVDQTAPTVRSTLEDFIGRFGCIAELHTDQGPQMTGEVLKEATKGLGIRHVLSTPHHHQSLGLVERFNKTFGGMLRCFVDQKDHTTWDLFVPSLLMAYRCSVQASTGQTPYFLVFGRDPVLAHDLEYGVEEEGCTDVSDYSAAARERQRIAWDWAKQMIGRAQLQQKGYYDSRAKECVLVAGDLVTKDNRYVRPGQSSKLVPKRVGLYRVVKIDFPNAVIKRMGTRKVEQVHMNRLRLSRQSGLFDYPSADEADENGEWLCPKCGLKYDAEDIEHSWVECENCGRWYDLGCIGLTDVPTMNEVWICDTCTQLHQDLCF